MNITITPVNLLYKNYTDFKKINHPKITPLKADTVSFTNNLKRIDYNNKSVEKSVELGQIVYNKTKTGKVGIEELKDLINSDEQDVEICLLEELENYVPNWEIYQALFHAALKEDFTFGDRKLFFNIKNYTDENEKLIFATSIAHEYTHFLNSKYDNKRIALLKKMTGNDYEKTTILMGPNEKIFTLFDNEIRQIAMTKTIKKFLATKEGKKYNQIIPQKGLVSKNDIFDSLGLNNEIEFQIFINSAFHEEFLMIIGEIIRDNPEYADEIPYYDDPIELENLFKEYCIIKAKEEVDAYMTESILAKKITGKNDLNIDIFPIYYQLVASALEKGIKNKTNC